MRLFKLQSTPCRCNIEKNNLENSRNHSGKYLWWRYLELSFSKKALYRRFCADNFLKCFQTVVPYDYWRLSLVDCFWYYAGKLPWRFFFDWSSHSKFFWNIAVIGLTEVFKKITGCISKALTRRDLLKMLSLQFEKMFWSNFCVSFCK